MLLDVLGALMVNLGDESESEQRISHPYLYLRYPSSFLLVSHRPRPRHIRCLHKTSPRKSESVWLLHVASSST